MILEVITRVLENMKKVIVGKQGVLEMMLCALLCEGHILVEDVPGIGKTTLSKSLARSIGCKFSRIQCTPDLLPSDITGTFFFDQKVSEFEFRPGPVMSNIVLVDEINRATPRTQSSFLESMEERQITVDGMTMPLPRPFLVIATQNPVELQGTFPLPEAQVDRFLIKLPIGYPTAEEEHAILLRFERQDPLGDLSPVTSPEELLDVQRQVQDVRIEASVRGYVVDVVRATRSHKDVQLGVSPRGTLALYKCAQAWAAIRGREYVLPDDIKLLAPYVLTHRILISPATRLRGRRLADVLMDVIETVPVPVERL